MFLLNGMYRINSCNVAFYGPIVKHNNGITKYGIELIFFIPLRNTKEYTMYYESEHERDTDLHMLDNTITILRYNENQR